MMTVDPKCKPWTVHSTQHTNNTMTEGLNGPYGLHWCQSPQTPQDPCPWARADNQDFRQSQSSTESMPLQGLGPSFACHVQWTRIDQRQLQEKITRNSLFSLTFHVQPRPGLLPCLTDYPSADGGGRCTSRRRNSMTRGWTQDGSKNEQPNPGSCS